MEPLARLLLWIGEREEILSGLAAAIAIASVLATLGVASARRLRRARREPPQRPGRAPEPPPPRIRYARTPDGVRLAWSELGEGPPLVRALSWFTHLEREWEEPRVRALLSELARGHRLIRYDGRGVGLSDREVAAFGLEERVLDLETVVDAAGLERFALLGLSEGGTTAIAYAARHPERVSHLVLFGTFLEGSGGSEAIRRRWEALATLAREGWGTARPTFRQLFTSLFLPSGDPAQVAFFNDMQGASASAETAARVIEATLAIDVREEASRVRAPTLVLHPRGDRVVPFEAGRRVAAAIPGGRAPTAPRREPLRLRGSRDRTRPRRGDGRLPGEGGAAGGRRRRGAVTSGHCGAGAPGPPRDGRSVLRAGPLDGAGRAPARPPPPRLEGS